MVGLGGGFGIGQWEDGDVWLVGQVDGDEGLRTKDFAAFFKADFGGFPIG